MHGNEVTHLQPDCGSVDCIYFHDTHSGHPGVCVHSSRVVRAWRIWLTHTVATAVGKRSVINRPIPRKACLYCSRKAMLITSHLQTAYPPEELRSMSPREDARRRLAALEVVSRPLAAAGM